MDNLGSIFCSETLGAGLIQAYIISAVICVSLGCIFFILSAFFTHFLVSGGVFCGLALIIMIIYVIHALCAYRRGADDTQKSYVQETRSNTESNSERKTRVFKAELALLRDDICRLPNRLLNVPIIQFIIYLLASLIGK